MDDEDDDLDDGLDDDDDEPETEVLVERGAFRVDPEVAAQKLRDYQLPDAHSFLVPWFRAASSLGAQGVSVRGLEDGLEFSFDGNPPAPEVLKELTAGLLDADHGEAGRHLAYGALAVRRLELGAPSAARVGGRTVISVKGGGAPARKALAALRSAYGLSTVKLLIDGSEVPDPAKARQPVRGWSNNSAEAVILDDPGVGSQGRVRFYKLGMLVEEAPCDLGGYYTAYVTNNRFALSLSQSSVVRDKRHGKTVRRLERLRRRLLRRDPPRETVARVWAQRALIAAGVLGASAFGLWRLLASGLLP